jgi:hypothetical protein
MSKTATYALIDSYTAPSGQTSVTFSSIPATYTDLILVVNTIVSSGTGAELSIRFNSDTTGNYSNTYLLGTGSATASGRGTNFTYADCGYLSSNSGNPNTRILHIQDYANTTTFKTIISRASGVNGAQVTAYANLWRKTPEAINSITIFSASSLTYATGSTFKLYGIQAGNA